MFAKSNPESPPEIPQVKRFEQAAPSVTMEEQHFGGFLNIPWLPMKKRV